MYFHLPALAKIERDSGNPAQAWTWVEEYGQPMVENHLWPRAAAHIEAAKTQFDLGRTYEAVSRLNTANERGEGLRARQEMSVASGWFFWPLAALIARYRPQRVFASLSPCQ